jgi:hypothetical protein
MLAFSLLTVIGEMKKLLKNTENRRFLMKFGRTPKRFSLTNQKHGALTSYILWSKII